MATVALKTLSIGLGIFFIFTGLLKITPYIVQELHKDLRKDFVKYTKVFPLTQLFGIRVPAKWYRRTIGTIELTSGVVLLAIPQALAKRLANILLLFVILLELYSHYMVNDKFDRTAPSAVFFFMLVGRIVIEYQGIRKEREKLSNGEIKTTKQD